MAAVRELAGRRCILLLGIAINLEKDSAGTLTASGALENVPSMLSPLALQAINSRLLDIPLRVMLYIDAVMEPVATVLISEQVSAPWPVRLASSTAVPRDSTS